jgi:osmotically-inducible protein OsmY
MNRTQARWVVLAVAALTISWASPVQAQETGKKVGEKLDEVGREIKAGLNRAGNAAKEQFARAKSSVQAMGMESRVYGRIHWDKALNDAVIDLTATGDGVVTLDGTVADARAKRRAVELTQDTVGVTRVIDRLAVRPAPSAGP